MKLFDAKHAPSPRRVRIFLAEKGIKIERETIDLRHDEQLSPAFLAVNPRGTVPALLLDDGTLINESSAICRYFEALQPEPNLFGRDAREIALVEAWTRRIETDCYAAIVYVFRNANPIFRDRGVTGKWPQLPQIPELVTRGRQMFETFLEAMDARLARESHVAGDRFTFADITLLVSLDFGKAAALVPDEKHTNLWRWWVAARERDSAKA